MVSTDEATKPITMKAEPTIVAATVKAATTAAPETASSPSPAVAPEPTEDGVREKPPMDDTEEKANEEQPKPEKEDSPADEPKESPIKVQTTTAELKSDLSHHVATPAPSKDSSEAGSEKEFKKKSGLRMYLASLTARNNAKREYLASLEESNRAKKQLLTTRAGKRSKKKDKAGTVEKKPAPAVKKAEPTPIPPAPVVAPVVPVPVEETPNTVAVPVQDISKAEEKKEEEETTISVTKPPSVAPIAPVPDATPTPAAAMNVDAPMVEESAAAPAVTFAPGTTASATGNNTDLLSEISDKLMDSLKKLGLEGGGVKKNTAAAVAPVAAAATATTTPTPQPVDASNRAVLVDANAAQKQEDDATQRAASWNCCAW